MNTLLLLVAVTWPMECTEAGRLYESAAKLRNTGITVEEATRNLTERTARAAMFHVYSRSDMTPRDWRFYIIGLCAGSAPEKKPRQKRQEAIGYLARSSK